MPGLSAQKVAAPLKASPADGVRLSRTHGAANSLMPDFTPTPIRLQTKLTVNTPGDKYEQEADRVAEQVMRMPEPQLQRQCACGNSTTHGECPECKKKKQDASGRLQRVSNSPVGGMAAPPIVNDVLASPGQPLDTTSRTFFEPRFVRDFSQVRVHSDDKAMASAASVQARAYTLGSNIVFNRGEYSPSSSLGQQLLAHELTHVVQQTVPRGIGENLPKTTIQREPSANPVADETAANQPTSGLSICYAVPGHPALIDCRPVDESEIEEVHVYGKKPDRTQKQKSTPSAATAESTSTSPTTEADSDSGTVGKPGFAESLVPIWGSGREAIYNFQKGNLGWGLVHTGLAISDVFLVKSAITAAGKVVLKAGMVGVVKEGGMIAVKETGEAVAKEGAEAVSKAVSKEGAEAVSKDAARATKSGIPIPQVADQKLKNLVTDLYKGAKGPKGPNTIGTGSTADAVRNELLTGRPTHGVFHSAKAGQYITALEKWLRKTPGASHHDKLVAQTLMDDLSAALRGQ